MEGDMKKLALILAVSLLFAVSAYGGESNWQTVGGVEVCQCAGESRWCRDVFCKKTIPDCKEVAKIVDGQAHGCIDYSGIYERPAEYPSLVIIKTEQKSRRHMTDCNHCDMTEGGIYSCTAMMCSMATYHYNEYSIGTADGKILFTIEDTEKVEE